jgi:hypothetical protein
MILCGQLHGKIGSRRLTRPHGCFFDRLEANPPLRFSFLAGSEMHHLRPTPTRRIDLLFTSQLASSWPSARPPGLAVLRRSSVGCRSRLCPPELSHLLSRGPCYAHLVEFELTRPARLVRSPQHYVSRPVLEKSRARRLDKRRSTPLACTPTLLWPSGGAA